MGPDPNSEPWELISRGRSPEPWASKHILHLLVGAKLLILLFSEVEQGACLCMVSACLWVTGAHAL